MSGEPGTGSVLHVDIDAFFASVEQVLFPALRGRPVIVGNGVIASVSYEGRRHGLKAGMPLWQARRLCPQVVILDGSYPVYRAFAENVFALCAERSPACETFLDEAYLDLRGCERLFGPTADVAAWLRARVLERTGLRVTCGVAPNRMLAKMVSKSAKPDGLGVLEPAAVEAFLVGRPVRELPGVGDKIARDFTAYGIRTVGELRDLPRAALGARYGRHGLALYERARGRDTVAVTPHEVPQSIARETTFHRPTSDPEEIAGMLWYLCERALKAARGLGLAAGRLDVALRYEDSRDPPSAGERLRPPLDVDAAAFAVARRLLARAHERRVNVRSLGITLSALVPAEPTRQGWLFDPAGMARARRLGATVDVIRDRFGHGAIVAGHSIALLEAPAATPAAGASPGLARDRHGFVLRTPSLTR